MAAQDPRLVKVRPNGMEDVPEYRIDIDWDKAGALGVPISTIHHTISSAFGSTYVNNFIQNGRVKRVYAQMDAPYRMLPEDLESLYVRNDSGKMVPYSSFATGHWTTGSPRLERYNGFPSVNIWGEPAPGMSSGDAMAAMEEFVTKLPSGIGHDWTGLSYQERMAGSQAPLLYAFSIFVIFLCLAALYESWPIPISILLTLPLGVIGGVIASSWRGDAQRRVFSDRIIDHARSDNEERDSDCAVCQGQGGGRYWTGGGGPGSGKTEAEADHHDVACFRLRCSAAVSCQWSRSRRPESDRHRGARRDGDLHYPDHSVCAALLCDHLQDNWKTQKADSDEKGCVRSCARRDTWIGNSRSCFWGSHFCSAAVPWLLSISARKRWIPGSWPEGEAFKDAGELSVLPEVKDLQWQQFFTDEKLKTIIGMALQNNLDLQLAVLNMERARAMYGVRRAELFPAVDASGTGGKERRSADLIRSGEPREVEQYGVGIGVASWEVDFFGRVGSLKDQALESYLATAQAQRSARVALIANVGTAYFALAADKADLELAQYTLVSQQDTWDMIRRSYEIGLSTEIDVHRVATQVEGCSKGCGPGKTACGPGQECAQSARRRAGARRDAAHRFE